MTANPWWLALAGVLIGIAGSLIGTYVSIVNAKSKEEHRFVVRDALGLALFISAFLLILAVSPAWLRPWLFLPYVLLLNLAIRKINTRLALMRSSRTN